MKGHFIITVDTEGDNLWNSIDEEITTKNIKYLPRFQELCEKYSFIPTWFTDYEIILEDDYVDYMKPKVKAGLCEVGMHLHPWNTPSGQKMDFNPKLKHSFVTQYSVDVIYEKIKTLTELIESRIGIKPTSHRAGRWVINDEYLEVLTRFGYKVDSSVTPHINWKKTINDNNASDYTKESELPEIKKFSSGKSIIEVPMTIRKLRVFSFQIGSPKFMLRNIQHIIFKKVCWLRPIGRNFKDMMATFDEADKQKSCYLMLMIHSSELMAGGSPYYQTENDIEMLYKNLEFLFNKIAKNYKGISLTDFANMIESEIVK